MTSVFFCFVFFFAFATVSSRKDGRRGETTRIGWEQVPLVTVAIGGSGLEELSSGIGSTRQRRRTQLPRSLGAGAAAFRFQDPALPAVDPETQPPVLCPLCLLEPETNQSKRLRLLVNTAGVGVNHPDGDGHPPPCASGRQLFYLCPDLP